MHPCPQNPSQWFRGKDKCQPSCKDKAGLQRPSSPFVKPGEKQHRTADDSSRRGTRPLTPGKDWRMCRKLAFPTKITRTGLRPDVVMRSTSSNQPCLGRKAYQQHTSSSLPSTQIWQQIAETQAGPRPSTYWKLDVGDFVGKSAIQRLRAAGTAGTRLPSRSWQRKRQLQGDIPMQPLPPRWDMYCSGGKTSENSSTSRPDRHRQRCQSWKKNQLYKSDTI